mgnify:CR=1 FL=1
MGWRVFAAGRGQPGGLPGESLAAGEGGGVDHLHEHFVDPCVVRDGAYTLPREPGYSAEIKAETLAAWAWPNGTEWTRRRQAVPA